jgi:hypothetical protein
LGLQKEAKAHSQYIVYFVIFAPSLKRLQIVMAENGGFEPPIELSPYNGLANRRLQPLGQLSVLVLLEQKMMFLWFFSLWLRQL